MREYYTEAFYASVLKSNINDKANAQRIHPPHGDPADSKSESSDKATKVKRLKTRLEELFGPDHGPKPITIQEYRSRNKQITTPKNNTIKKKRGGKLNAARCKIGNLKRLIGLAITPEEKIVFIRQLRAAKIEEKQRLKAKKHKKDDIMDNMFNNLFRIGEQFST